MAYQHHEYLENYTDYKLNTRDEVDLWYDSLPWWKKAGLYAFAILLPFIGSIANINF